MEAEATVCRVIEFIARLRWNWRDWRAGRVLSRSQVAAWMRESWTHQPAVRRATGKVPVWWWVVAVVVAVRELPKAAVEGGRSVLTRTL